MAEYTFQCPECGAVRVETIPYEWRNDTEFECVCNLPQPVMERVFDGATVHIQDTNNRFYKSKEISKQFVEGRTDAEKAEFKRKVMSGELQKIK